MRLKQRPFLPEAIRESPLSSEAFSESRKTKTGRNGGPFNSIDDGILKWKGKLDFASLNLARAKDLIYSNGHSLNEEKLAETKHLELMMIWPGQARPCRTGLSDWKMSEKNKKKPTKQAHFYGVSLMDGSRNAAVAVIFIRVSWSYWTWDLGDSLTHWLNDWGAYSFLQSKTQQNKTRPTSQSASGELAKGQQEPESA